MIGDWWLVIWLVPIILITSCDSDMLLFDSIDYAFFSHTCTTYRRVPLWKQKPRPRLCTPLARTKPGRAGCRSMENGCTTISSILQILPSSLPNHPRMYLHMSLLSPLLLPPPTNQHIFLPFINHLKHPMSISNDSEYRREDRRVHLWPFFVEFFIKYSVQNYLMYILWIGWQTWNMIFGSNTWYDMTRHLHPSWGWPSSSSSSSTSSSSSSSSSSSKAYQFTNKPKPKG